MASFKYLPLDPSKQEIRLISLLPRSQESQSDQVCCTLEHASLEDDLRYSALSYVWGLPGITQPILVNGFIFEAPANLESALRHRQHDSEVVTLWVDAICINQRDDTEKTQQVMQMDLIYTRAMKVLVWLGPPSEDSDLAIDKLEALGKEAISAGILEDWDEFPNIPKGNRKAARRRRLNKMLYNFSCGDSTFHTIPAAATRSLFDRPWWGRVWVLQELVLADTAFFVCGDKVVNWDDLKAALLLFLLYRRMGLIGGDTLFNLESFNPRPKLICLMSHTYQRDDGSAKFWIYLTTTCNAAEGRIEGGWGFFNATDPRDKIFALLSISDDAADLGIQPDYSKPCGAIYTDTSEAIIKAVGLKVLNYCQWPKSVTGLPSWVPDWSLSLQPVLFDDVVHSELYSASGSSKFTVAFGGDNRSAKVLSVSGVRVDKILHTGNACSKNWRQIEKTIAFTTSWLAEFQRLAELGANSCYSPTQRAEALWQTPIAGWKRRCTSADLAHRHHGILTGAINPTPSGVQDVESLRLSEAAMYHEAMITIAGHRRPFITTQGYLGLGPERLEKGDLICIFFGGNIPFILREGHEGQYELVGETYVHGIMHGEWMKDDPNIEAFQIC